MTQPSEIAEFYKNKIVLITGGTGFMGKLLIEKLLRSCPEIKTIYVLVRSKKGNTPQQRINLLLSSSLFDLTCISNPRFQSKVKVIHGDLIMPSMGIRSDDEKTLNENVNIVFHLAALVKPDESLKESVQINILGAQKVVELCKKMMRLEAVVHVSSTFAHRNRQMVKERVYKSPANPERLVKCTEWISDDVATKITPCTIGKRPNIYSYTTAIAESVVKKECGKQVPCAIVRPSMLGATWKGPIAGWVDNFNAPTTLFKYMEKGSECPAEIVPVDMAVNLIIVAAWERATRKTKSTKIRVYNNTTSQANKTTWRAIQKLSRECFWKHPIDNMFLMPSTLMNPGLLASDRINRLEKLLPTYISELFHEKVTRRNPLENKSVSKEDYFLSNQRNLITNRVAALETKMNNTDRKTFYIDVKDIDWKVYMENYCQGIKKHLLNNELYKFGRNPLTSEDRSGMMMANKDAGSLFVGLIFLKCCIFIFLSLLFIVF